MEASQLTRSLGRPAVWLAGRVNRVYLMFCLHKWPLVITTCTPVCRLEGEEEAEAEEEEEEDVNKRYRRSRLCIIVMSRPIDSNARLRMALSRLSAGPVSYGRHLGSERRNSL